MQAPARSDEHGSRVPGRCASSAASPNQSPTRADASSILVSRPQIVRGVNASLPALKLNGIQIDLSSLKRNFRFHLFLRWRRRPSQPN
eukprot:3200523-Pleurochrysis_carterae.AAC.1